MYLDFYKLREAPFNLTPDPKFIFKTDSYLEMLSTIKYGVEQCKGIVVAIGEVGTGKTTTLRSALHQFNSEVLAVYIFNPFLNVAEFFDLLCGGLGLGLAPTAPKSERLNALGRLFAARHARGLKTSLIIDEAHGVSPEVLEEIRLLANFETSSEKLLQIVLCGQPELREMLNRPEMRQLKQRVSLRCQLVPLGPLEINEYLRFRLKVAGGGRVNLFDPEAIAIITRVSQGIPRVINNVCDNALLYGYGAGKEVIGGEILREVVDMLDLAPPDPLRNLAGEVCNSIGSTP